MQKYQIFHVDVLYYIRVCVAFMHVCKLISDSSEDKTSFLSLQPWLGLLYYSVSIAAHQSAARQH